MGDQAAQPAPPVNPTHQANQQRIQAAKERAHELLMNHLSPEQRKTFDKHHWFVVEGGKSKQKYKVHCRSGMSGNIEVVGKLYRLCAHLSGDIPIGDQLLAQKVMLELDEDHFVHTANVHPIYA